MTENPELAPPAPSTRALRETRLAVDMGDRHLMLNTSGAGSPTVVLETGLGAESDEWARVQRGIESLTRVCRYDRAGRGASDPAPRPRSAGDMVADLRALLQKAAITGPYVLVGHSFGGLLVRVFAHRYPRDVAGLVLVDAMHEDQFEVFGPTFPPPAQDDPPALANVRAFWTGGWRDPGATQEGIDLVASCAQARAITSLGDVPLHVLVAGTYLHQPLVPEGRRAGLQQMWDRQQQQLLRLSANATLSEVKTSSHFIQRAAPQRVVDAIGQVVEQVRQRAR